MIGLFTMPHYIVALYISVFDLLTCHDKFFFLFFYYLIFCYKFVGNTQIIFSIITFFECRCYCCWDVCLALLKLSDGGLYCD